MPETTEPSVMTSALTCRCPRCGVGLLFRQLLNMRASCSGCGLDFGHFDPGDGPAVFVIFVLGALMMGGALYVEFGYAPEVWVHVVLWGLLTPLLAIILLRFTKALLIALQFRHKAEEGRLKNGE